MTDAVALLLGDLRAWQFVLVLAAAFSTSIFHTMSGFAGGVLLSFLIAPLLGVEAVIPVLAVALTISATSRAWAFRRDVDWRVLATIMAPATPAIVAGSLVYTLMPIAAISIVLGVFLLATVMLRRPLRQGSQGVGTFGLGLAGAAFGALSGITIGAGMILAPFLMGRGLVRERFAAVFACIALLLNATKSTVFLATATLDAHLVTLGVAIGLCTIPGTWLGYELLMRTSVRVHTAFVEALIVIGGVGFVWYGLAAI
ncbi:MAG: TSUP family transporter [Rhizobiaceae bacterium]